MPGFMENVSTVNSLVRTILALVVVGAAGLGGLFAYRTYNEGDKAQSRLEEAEKQLDDVKAKLQTKSEQLNDKLQELTQKNKKIQQQEGQIVELNETIDEKNELIEKQAIAMRLLKKDQRKAIITVLKQTGEGDDQMTTIRWVELGEDNRPIDERIFDLNGDIVKIDAWGRQVRRPLHRRGRSDSRHVDLFVSGNLRRICPARGCQRSGRSWIAAQRLSPRKTDFRL